jgi:flagellar FliL protein
MTTMRALGPPVPEEAESEEEKAPRSRKKLIVIALVVALLAGTAWWMLRPSGPHVPEPGEIVTLESTQINLAEGHYLKIGVALQLEKGAHEIDGSKALDATIDIFSGLDMADVSAPQRRHALKKRLTEQLSETYDGDVMGVYFTEFVTQ